MDDGSPPRKQVLKSHKESKIDSSDSTRRKVVQKTVVKFRIEAQVGKQKGECPPPDFWSWRKYGQKPIKGSPYPRGYYRCSTCKGCSAKKQVERSKIDSSVLIITYTSDHNHPSPHLPSITPRDQPSPKSPSQQPSTTSEESLSNEKPPLLPCPPKSLQEDNTQLQSPPTEQVHDHQLDVLYGGEPFSSSTTKANEEMNDFYDELEELPIPSPLSSLVRESFFDERILFLPS